MNVLPHQILVKLEWFELVAAAQQGVLRHALAVTGKLKNPLMDDRDGWTSHCEGAIGELVVARAMDRYWNGSVNTFKKDGDVGPFQVRTRSEHWHDLNVRKNDSDTQAFILVTGQAPVYVVRGWIRGREAKQDKWWANPGGFGFAWFVPQSELHPIAHLTPELLAEWAVQKADTRGASGGFTSSQGA